MNLKNVIHNLFGLSTCLEHFGLYVSYSKVNVELAVIYKLTARVTPRMHSGDHYLLHYYLLFLRTIFFCRRNIEAVIAYPANYTLACGAWWNAPPSSGRLRDYASLYWAVSCVAEAETNRSGSCRSRSPQCSDPLTSGCLLYTSRCV